MYRQTLLNKKNKYGDSLRFRRGFTSAFSLLVRFQRWSWIRLDKEKNSNFQELLTVSYWQEMSLFMDNLSTSNVPVFNAKGS